MQRLANRGVVHGSWSTVPPLDALGGLARGFPSSIDQPSLPAHHGSLASLAATGTVAVGLKHSHSYSHVHATCGLNPFVGCSLRSPALLTADRGNYWPRSPWLGPGLRLNGPQARVEWCLVSCPCLRGREEVAKLLLVPHADKRATQARDKRT